MTVFMCVFIHIILCIIIQVQNSNVGMQYHRTGFDCEYLLNANCEFFYNSLIRYNKSNNSTPYGAASCQCIRFACRQNPQNAIITLRMHPEVFK